MKKYVCLIFAGMLLLFCVACQPTPEEEIVTNKGDGVMEEKIFATAAPTAEVDVEEASAEPTAVPFEKVEHWTETFNVNENLAVEIDCDVEWGEGYEYHVEKFFSQAFTAEQIVNYANVFFGDIVSLREQETSYDDYLEKLLKVEKGIYQGKDADGEAIWEPYSKSKKKELLDEIKAEMEKVPVESTYIPFSTNTLSLVDGEYNTFTILRKSGAEGRIGVTVAEGKSDVSFFSYTKGSTSSASFIQQEILFSGGEYYDTLPEPSITAEEAIAKANAFLTSIGLDNVECSYSEKTRLSQYDETFSEGWFLEYAYALKGMRGVSLVAYSKNAIFSPELANSYSRPLETEYISLYVTEKGVQSFTWENPYDLQEVTNENVEILPFEEIQESVRKYFNLAFAWADNPKSTGTSKLLVKRVVLTSYFVQVKDDPDGAYRVPVWAVFYLGDDEEEAYCAESVMIINALDGTMIYK